MANATIDIKEDASPTKKLASQSFTRGVDTVHQEEVALGDGTNNGRLVAVTATNALKVDNSAVVQPVSDNGGALTVDALDLDIRNLATGQDTVDARLRDAADATFIDPVIKAQLPAALVGGRLDINIGATIAVPVTDNAGSLTVDAPVGTPAFVRLSDGAAALIGQKAMAASVPVVIASDQSTVPTSEPVVDLAPASPAAASVGVASAQAVAANGSRKGLVLTNTSAARISLGFGAAAVLDSGITLYPGGSFNMEKYDFDQGAVNAIASAAASNLGIQEYS